MPCDLFCAAFAFLKIDDVLQLPSIALDAAKAKCGRRINVPCKRCRLLGGWYAGAVRADIIVDKYRQRLPAFGVGRRRQHGDIRWVIGDDGQIIRVVVPQLSEERRRDMVKVARGKGEDARVTVRSVRRKAMDELARIVKDGEAGEDEVARAEKELQATVDKYVHQIDELVKHKETELLEV